ncbi:MAG: hypothetical protein NC080_07405 [Paraprevotella sp.]|nr:hypothetical protein [Paraprevotella sp.]
MAILKSARNGLLISLTSDSASKVLPLYGNGEDNKVLFGKIHSNFRKATDDKVTISTSASATEAVEKEAQPAEPVLANDPTVSKESNEKKAKAKRQGRSNKAPAEPEGEAKAPEGEITATDLV